MGRHNGSVIILCEVKSSSKYKHPVVECKLSFPELSYMKIAANGEGRRI